MYSMLWLPDHGRQVFLKFIFLTISQFWIVKIRPVLFESVLRTSYNLYVTAVTTVRASNYFKRLQWSNSTEQVTASSNFGKNLPLSNFSK